MKLHKLPVYLTFVLIFAIVVSVDVAEATSTSFTVHGGEDVVKTIKLAVEDHVSIKFTVVGQTNHAITFYMVYPNGSIRDFGNVGSFSYSFVCNLEGEYRLYFSNMASSEEKLVTLDYEIEHYIFGIPQMFFLTIIIVLVCLAAVATFVLMGKPR
jgi:hypothetical protein